MSTSDHGAAAQPAEGAGPMHGLPAAAPYPESVWPTPLRPDVDPDLYFDALQLGAHVNLHAQIDASAADLRAWVKRECSMLRRATSQHFRWASMLRSSPPPRA